MTIQNHHWTTLSLHGRANIRRCFVTERLKAAEGSLSHQMLLFYSIKAVPVDTVLLLRFVHFLFSCYWPAPGLRLDRGLSFTQACLCSRHCGLHGAVPWPSVSERAAVRPNWSGRGGIERGTLRHWRFALPPPSPLVRLLFYGTPGPKKVRTLRVRSVAFVKNCSRVAFFFSRQGSLCSRISPVPQITKYT